MQILDPNVHNIYLADGFHWAFQALRIKYRQRGFLFMKTSIRKDSTGRRTPTYVSWLSMRQRISDKRHYKDYRDRGISICKRWERFENFLSDMGERPVELSLDRINNSGNYKPSNCRWATPLEQIRNSRIPKITVEKVAVAKALVKQGFTTQQIATRLNTSWDTIALIRNGRIWKDVPVAASVLFGT